MNPYYVFFQKICSAEGLTISGFAKKYNLPAFNSLMNQLKNDPEKTLRPDTLKVISDNINAVRGTNIRIDDTVKNGIRFVSNSDTIYKIGKGGKHVRVPIIDGVAMQKLPSLVIENNGKLSVEDIFNISTDSLEVPYQHPNIFGFKVEEDCNADYIYKNDIILFDLKLPVTDSSWVGCVLKDGKYYIGQYREINNAKVMISFYNRSYTPVLLSKNEIRLCLRVAASWRNLL